MHAKSRTWENKFEDKYPSKGKARLPHMSSFLSWFHTCFPSGSSPAQETASPNSWSTLQSAWTLNSSKAMGAFLDASVPWWDVVIHMGAWPVYTQLPLFSPTTYILCSLQIRLRESQMSCTSGSQGLFCCISADCKWKQNGRGWVTLLGLYFLMWIWEELKCPSMYTRSVFSVSYAGL